MWGTWNTDNLIADLPGFSQAYVFLLLIHPVMGLPLKRSKEIYLLKITDKAGRRSIVWVACVHYLIKIAV